ncbi:hypothetical protein [Marimonas arenosa]|uniref:Uncharacterized protein n=1 Tax=Marimonas arenosa TaxID=1795305 RepID=A0AAE4B3A0_9RHOB|nr:hypothetical protein [Marimonas arenosa]MDQ2089838.1 hypothetical protein [Marimonas arenosa]
MERELGHVRAVVSCIQAEFFTELLHEQVKITARFLRCFYGVLASFRHEQHAAGGLKMAYITSEKLSRQVPLVKLAGRFLTRIRRARRTARDKRIMAQLPSDRLADMGLPKVTDANSRSSGEAGDIPRADMW